MTTTEDFPSESDVDGLLKKAIEERERGNLKESLALLKTCEKLSKDDKQRRDIQNHIGLTHFHAGEYKTAYVVWTGVKKSSKENDDLYNEAVALRNLSRKEFHSEENLPIARTYAEKALEIARETDQRDIVWFIHGLFDVTNASENISKKDKKEKLLELYKQEKKALFSVWKIASRIEREVWLTGLLKDFLVVHNYISKPILRIGILVTKVLKLKRREEQLKILIWGCAKSSKILCYIKNNVSKLIVAKSNLIYEQPSINSDSMGIFSNPANVVLSIIILLCVVFLIFLLLREFACWYWKINDIKKLLEDIKNNTQQNCGKSQDNLTDEDNSIPNPKT